MTIFSNSISSTPGWLFYILSMPRSPLSNYLSNIIAFYFYLGDIRWFDKSRRDWWDLVRLSYAVSWINLKFWWYEQRRPQVRECGIITNYKMFKSLPVVHRIAASTIFRTRNTSSIFRGAYTIIYPRHLISEDSPSTDHASIGQNWPILEAPLMASRSGDPNAL